MSKWNNALSRFHTVWQHAQATHPEPDQATDGLAALTRERDRARERLQSARLEVLAQLAGPDTLEQVLDTVLAHLSGICPGHPAAICLLDPRSKRLRVGAMLGLPDSYRLAVEGLELGPQTGSIAAATFCGNGVVSEDLEIDPNWTRYRGLALEADLGACWAEPIRGSGGQVLGGFAVYARSPKSPDTQDLALLREAARLAGMIIDYKAADPFKPGPGPVPGRR